VSLKIQNILLGTSFYTNSSQLTSLTPMVVHAIF